MSLRVLPMLLCLAACSDIICTNQTVRSLNSPDGKQRAILFMRECGATTDFSTQVSIVSSAGPFDGIGNVFVADAHDRDARRGSWGGPWAEIAWITRQRLLVTYDAKARIFMQNAKVREVQITYRRVHR